MNGSYPIKINTVNTSIAFLSFMALMLWVFTGPLEKGLNERSVYSAAEIRFTNLADIRVADYMV